jgi:N-acetylglucosamine-6-phosphate deacetylase
MTAISLQNAKVVRHGQVEENGSVVVENGWIVEETSRDFGQVVDCTGLTLLPGFIDIHIHGAVGVDVNSGNLDGLYAVAKFLAENGVTRWLPTLVPDSDDNYLRVVGAIERLMQIQSGEPIARVEGIHYEGVFANDKMCGALRPQFFKSFTGSELSSLPRLSRGAHMTTFAPEIENGIDLTRELVKLGWIASVGHTKAPVAILEEAFAEGARHLTHFFNAMTPMHHRDIGVVGWALTNAGVTFDIIADGIHVHPTMLEFATRSKTPLHVSLISDSIAPTGLGDGEYEMWGENISIEEGRTRNERGSIAGSVITVLDAVKPMRGVGFSEVELSMMSSLNPARLIGCDDVLGLITPAKRADIIGLDEHGNTRLTLIDGIVAFDDR